jgi:hypothetical protein
MQRRLVVASEKVACFFLTGDLPHNDAHVGTHRHCRVEGTLRIGRVPSSRDDLDRGERVVRLGVRSRPCSPLDLYIEEIQQTGRQLGLRSAVHEGHRAGGPLVLPSQALHSLGTAHDTIAIRNCGVAFAGDGQASRSAAPTTSRVARSRKASEYCVCLDIDALHSMKNVEPHSISFWGRIPNMRCALF